MDVIEEVLGYWNDPATVQRYDGQAGHGLRTPEERHAWLEELRDLMPESPSDVVDIGTGTGFLAMLAAALGHRVTGFDIARNMLARARAKAREEGLPIDFREGDAAYPPVGPNTADVVMNRHLLWTLPNPTEAVSTWAGILRPGGRLIVIDAAWFADPALSRDDTVETDWTRYYRPDVVAALPLMTAVDAAPVIQLFTNAGLHDVRVGRLKRVEAVERVLGDRGDPHGEPARYVISGVK